MKRLAIKKLSLSDVDVDDAALQAFSRVEELQLSFFVRDVNFAAQSLKCLAGLNTLNITVIDVGGRRRIALDAWTSNLVLEGFDIQVTSTKHTWGLRALRT